MTISLAIPASAGVPDGEAPSLAPCASEAVDLGAAREMAARCGTAVEVVSERTEWALTFAHPDGSMSLDATTNAQRTQVSGVWEPVDASLVVADGSITVASPVVQMEFSDGTPGVPLARVARGGHEVVFDAPFGLTTPVVEGSQILYPNVVDGVDLVVSVRDDATGFTEVLRIASPEAAARLGVGEVAFDLDTDASTTVRPAGGGVEFVDGAGEVVLVSPPALMWDPAGSVAVRSFAQLATRQGPLAGSNDAPVAVVDDDRVLGAQGGDQVAVMPLEVGEGTVSITPDEEMVASPETVWPVFVDPGVSAILNSWGLLTTSWPDLPQFLPSGTMGVGLCATWMDPACGHTGVHRPVWEFGGLDVLKNLRLGGADVKSAIFTVFGSHSWNCDPQLVQAYATNPYGPGSTWNNHAGTWGIPMGWQNVAHRNGCPAGSNPRDIEFDVTPGAKVIADAKSNALTIGLRSVNEGAMQHWKRYRTDAKLSVQWNQTPVAPVDARIDDPATPCVIGESRPVIRSLTPTLGATLLHPDGLDMRYRFQIFRHPGAVPVWDTGWEGPIGHGQRATTRLYPWVAPDGIYSWQVQAMDAYANPNLIGPSTWCEFAVDSTPPHPVTVAAVPGGDVVYEKDTAAGGVGLEGHFHLVSSPDVAYFAYSWDSEAVNQIVYPSSPGLAGVAWRPATAGTHVLYVHAVDHAGNTTLAPTKYSVRVAPAGRDGRWELLEGQGATTMNDLGPDKAGEQVPLQIANATWATDGPMAFLDGGSDPVLKATGGGVLASTSARVVDTTKSFTVQAVVRLDAVPAGGRAVALSQFAASNEAFGLGVESSSSCPPGQTCWVMTMADTTNGGTVWARSGVPARQGQWTAISGMYDATSKEMTLRTCRLDPSNPPYEERDWSVKQAAGSQTLTESRSGLTLGDARPGSTAHWTGSVAHVEVRGGLTGEDDFKQLCDLVEP